MNTVVTFTDADGDEFPMIVIGFEPTDEAMRIAIEEHARQKMQRVIETGMVRPTLPLKVTKVEAD